MNKTLLIPIALCFVSLSASAQLNSIETDEQIVRRLIMRGADLPPGMTDSPYDNDAFQPGKVIIKDTITQNAMLRYDAYRDNIEAKEDGETYSLFKREYIRAYINSEFYGIFSYQTTKGETKQGYFIILTEGPLKLLKRKFKTFHYGTKGDGYTAAKPPRFTNTIEYYLQSGEEMARPVKLRKKTVLEALGNTKEANKTVKELKLNLSKEYDVVQLIKTLE